MSPLPQPADTRPSDTAERLLWGVLGVVLFAVVVARLRLLATPLERDEGEYAYTGLLFLKGAAPYQSAYTMKLPGTGLMYAAFMLLFGRSASAIRFGFLLANLASTGMVALLAKRLLGPRAAAPAAAAFAVLSLSQGVLGPFAHATHLVVLFSLAGSLLLLSHLDQPRPAKAWASGLLFGLAVLMKQHAALLAALALLQLCLAKPAPARRRSGDAALFLLGAAMPLLAAAAWVTSAGLGARAWFWTVSYARNYATGPSLAQGLQALGGQLTQLSDRQPGFWLAGALGLGLLLSGRLPGSRAFLLGYLTASFLALCPGLYLREHYFVLLLPPLALLGGGAFAALGALAPARWPNPLRQACPALLLAAVSAGALYGERRMLFQASSAQVSRDCYEANPFPESPVIAAYIQAHSGPEDSIGILGSEPQICFYADRPSASGHIYMYGLMEDQPYALRMQQEFIAEIEARRPLYMVAVNVPTSWLARPASPQLLTQWSQAYGRKHYRCVGIINIHQDQTQYLWDAAVQGQSATPYSVTVWRRQDEPRK